MSESAKEESQQQQEARESVQDNVRTMKREHDSSDDFEHLEPESNDGSVPLVENRTSTQPTGNSSTTTSTPSLMTDQEQRPSQEAQPRLVDLPRVDYDLVDLQDMTVPATPPPSADFEKFDSMSDPFQGPPRPPPAAQQHQQPLNDPLSFEKVLDSKAASLAFVETERTHAAARDDDHRDAVASFIDRQKPNDDIVSFVSVDKAKSSESSAGDDLLGSLSKDSMPELASFAPKDGQGDAKPESLLDKEKERKVGDTEAKSVKDQRKIAEDKALIPELSMDDQRDIVEQKDRDDETSVFSVEKKSSGQEEKAEDGKKDDRNHLKEIIDFVDSWSVVDKPNESNEETSLEENTASTKSVSSTVPSNEAISSTQKEPGNEDKDEERKVSSHEKLEDQPSKSKQQSEAGDSEFESEPEPSPAKKTPVIPSATSTKVEDSSDRIYSCCRPRSKVEEIEIAPQEIFRNMGLDAWFNPERLNPEVAALIYWRDPEMSGVVFGTILGLLLSLAYFSLISVLAYLSLCILFGTLTYRVYKSVLQAVQKTSDGHPFKYILDIDLMLPTEKLHEVVDVAAANVNAVVGELRRLFLVEDIIDSLKFGVLLWCLTYVGSWFNGMTLIIIGVVALFTLPKLYETNKTQIDDNLALVQGKINDLTAKIKAAIPLVNKPEAVKEE